MSWTLSDQEFSVLSAPRVLRARPLGVLVASMIGVVPICLLAVVLAFGDKSSLEEAKIAQPTAAAPAAAPEKITKKVTALPAAVAAPAEPAKPSAAFVLSAPEFDKEKKPYSSLENEGGGRQHILLFGDFEGAGNYLRLDIHENGGEKLGSSDFFLDMTRHAAQAGLTVGRIGRPAPLPSRFGTFESADIRLVGEGAAPITDRSCLAVRLMNPKLSLEIAGVGCGTAAKPIDRRAMSCILDRLEYSGGENKPLQQFFAEAETKRGQGCIGAAAPTKTSQRQETRSQPKKRATTGAR